MNFNAEMIKAIREGRKTQTRRVCKDQTADSYTFETNIMTFPGAELYTGWAKSCGHKFLLSTKCHYGKVGGRLSVKEERMETRGGFVKHRVAFDTDITLEITDIRVERLQEITNSDVEQEGFMSEHRLPDYKGFQALWNSLHKKEHRWKDNPWVWVISFKVVK